MTRKRFVKLMMSCGHNRDYANAYAKATIVTYGSYQKLWEASYWLKLIHTMQCLANSLIPVFNQLYQQIKAWLSQVRNWGENHDRSYAGNSAEVAAANFPGRKECRNPEKSAEHSGTVLG